MAGSYISIKLDLSTISKLQLEVLLCAAALCSHLLSATLCSLSLLSTKIDLMLTLCMILSLLLSHSLVPHHIYCGAAFGFGHLPFNLTLTQSHTHTHSLSLVLVVMIKSKELKTKISDAHSLIHSLVPHCSGTLFPLPTI